MSQTIFTTINPATTSGTQLATILVDFKNAYVSGNSGPTRPAALQAGGFWIDTSQELTPTFLWSFKFYTGSTDVTVFQINLATNTTIFSGTSNIFELSRISADTAGPIFKFLKERIATNGQVLDGDAVGEIQFVGTDDTGLNPVVSKIRVEANEDMTGTASGGDLIFETTTTGSASLVEVMRISSGQLGIGTTTPANTLHVAGTGIRADKVSNDALPSQIILKKRRTTGNQVQASDAVGLVDFRSTTDANADISVAKVEAIALENHTSSAQGSAIALSTKDSTTNTYSEKIRVGSTIELKEKTSVEALILSQQDVASTATIAALSADKCIVNITGSTATQIQGISSTGKTKTLLIHNAASATVTLLSEDAGASASNRLLLPGGAAIVLAEGQSVELFYNTAASRWKLKSGSGSAGSGGAGSLTWNAPEGTGAIQTEEYGLKVFVFEKDAGQEITAFVEVPGSYNAGVQPFVKTVSYCNSTDAHAFEVTSYLIKASTDTPYSTTNSNVETSGDLGLAGADLTMAIETPLSDADGLINGVAIEPFDFIKIVIKRGTPSVTEATEDVKVIFGSMGVKFA